MSEDCACPCHYDGTDGGDGLSTCFLTCQNCYDSCDCPRLDGA